jgi:DNA-directed RNA polymerase subunit RPC12/RpoP
MGEKCGNCGATSNVVPKDDVSYKCLECPDCGHKHTALNVSVKEKAKLYLASAWSWVVKWFDPKWYKFLLKRRRGAKATLKEIREELEDAGYVLMCYDERVMWDYSEALMHIMMALTKIQELDDKQQEQIKEFEEEI